MGLKVEVSMLEWLHCVWLEELPDDMFSGRPRGMSCGALLRGSAGLSRKPGLMAAEAIIKFGSLVLQDPEQIEAKCRCLKAKNQGETVIIVMTGKVRVTAHGPDCKES